jgi:hypothetical protein
LADVAHRRAAQGDGSRDSGKVAFDQSDPGALNSDLGADPHGDANRGFG